MRFALFALLLLLSLGSCNPKKHDDWRQHAANPDFLHDAMGALLGAVVYDIFTPPVAARIYAYPSIAAYEALRHDNSAYRSLAGQLNGLTPLPEPETGKTYCFPLAALQAFCKMGKVLVFSEEKMEDARERYIRQYTEAIGVPEDVVQRSLAYGDKVFEHINAWAKQDNYAETRTYPKYTVTGKAGKWEPTPPVYMDALEPNWMFIRPFTLDSASQFKPLPPAPVDLKPGSVFHQQMMETYETVNKINKEDSLTAWYWDDNSLISHVQGHVMFTTKKLSPGGHWISIASSAALKSKHDMLQSAETYALVSISLLDAFISCWDEKYRSEYIRPETVINQNIDPDWRPLLQTPPFPEYTSGHSVVSGAAATILSRIYGEPFAFTDTAEVEYGMTARNFESFRAASNQAAISRLYGGIHFRDAVEKGITQGIAVGEHVLKRVATRKGA